MSNAPTVLLGFMPLARAFVRSAADATATTVTPDDSGTVFVNMSASAHTYTLPTVTDCAGKAFIFFAGNSTEDMIITGGTADKIMALDNTGADTIQTGTSSDDPLVGDWVMVIGDGTYYYALVSTGTWQASG